MDDKTHKLKTLGSGVLIGVVGSTISAASNEFLHVPLAFSPMSFKNFLKVAVVSGLSTMGVVWGIEEIKEWKDSRKGSGSKT